MEQPLVLIVSLVLVSFCRGQDWVVQEYCSYETCPHFQLKSNMGFEERFYGASEWISTTIKSTESSDVMAAHKRLTEYCEKQKDNGYEIPYAWPVLITVTDESDLVLSWFVPPDTNLNPEITVPLVTLQSRPAATIYVRVFGGTPTIQNAETNAQTLRTDLSDAGKAFNTHTYSGAGYESYFAVTHHNELWIPAA